MAHYPSAITGSSNGSGKKFAVIVSQFNQSITTKLLTGALDCFEQHGVTVDTDVDVYECPGAFELPQVASQITMTKRYQAVVCLGAVIRGETPHFDYICQECARGIGAVARERHVPVLFGVLTTTTYEQAAERAGGKFGNKGWDAALSAITMANLFSKIDG